MKRYQYVADFIHSNDKFILTAHETPDGDAIGSESAMYNALLSLGKQVTVVNADPMAEKYTFLDFDENFDVLNPDSFALESIEEYSLIILDTNDIHNIGNVREVIFENVKNYIIIDHHESMEAFSEEMLILSSSSSTCEILYQLFEFMKIDLSLRISQALYVGIVYDTGSFIYPKTTAKTFSIAHQLVKSGVVPNDMYSRIYESNSVESLKLQSRISSTLALYYNQHVAVQIMLKEDISECGAKYEDADPIINIPLKSEAIKVSVFFKENPAGILRCSMRSKGNIDVSSIAQYFDGGGHKTAAGFKSKFPLEVIKEKVLDMLGVYFN